MKGRAASRALGVLGAQVGVENAQHLKAICGV